MSFVISLFVWFDKSLFQRGEFNTLSGTVNERRAPHWCDIDCWQNERSSIIVYLMRTENGGGGLPRWSLTPICLLVGYILCRIYQRAQIKNGMTINNSRISCEENNCVTIILIRGPNYHSTALAAFIDLEIQSCMTSLSVTKFIAVASNACKLGGGSTLYDSSSALDSCVTDESSSVISTKLAAGVSVLVSLLSDFFWRNFWQIWQSAGVCVCHLMRARWVASK